MILDKYSQNWVSGVEYPLSSRNFIPTTECDQMSMIILEHRKRECSKEDNADRGSEKKETI